MHYIGVDKNRDCTGFGRATVMRIRQQHGPKESFSGKAPHLIDFHLSSDGEVSSLVPNLYKPVEK
jgi:hypothetical protein